MKNKENIYFLNAAGGTGKTFIINLLFRKCAPRRRLI